MHQAGLDGRVREGSLDRVREAGEPSTQTNRMSATPRVRRITVTSAPMGAKEVGSDLAGNDPFPATPYEPARTPTRSLAAHNRAEHCRLRASIDERQRQPGSSPPVRVPAPGVPSAPPASGDEQVRSHARVEIRIGSSRGHEAHDVVAGVRRQSRAIPALTRRAARARSRSASPHRCRSTCSGGAASSRLVDLDQRGSRLPHTRLPARWPEELAKRW